MSVLELFHPSCPVFSLRDNSVDLEMPQASAGYLPSSFASSLAAAETAFYCDKISSATEAFQKRPPPATSLSR